jgi:arsenite methyltransferase
MMLRIVYSHDRKYRSGGVAMGIRFLINKLFGRVARHSDAAELLAGVREAYSSAAIDPAKRHPFPVGRAFAEELGYSKSLLDSLPEEAVNSFVGVGRVGEFAEITPGAVVLDLGCGAGLDSLVAARKTGFHGRVIGVDFSLAMLRRAIAAGRRAGMNTILYCCADAGNLPIPTAAIDVVLVNGIFNLNPARRELFQEMARVLRPGGAVFASELIFTRPQTIRAARDVNEWLS